MKNIDISHFEDKRVRTLLHFLNVMYKCELQPKERIVDEFVDTYLFEAKEFIRENTNGSYRQLNNLKFVSDKTPYDKDNLVRDYLLNNDSHNSGIYNVCTLLACIDRDYKYNFEILDEIELGEYEKVANLLSDKIENLSIIQQGVSSYIIENNQRNNIFRFEKHYNVVPDICINLIEQRKLQYMKTLQRKADENDMFVTDILLLFELSIVKRKTDILKLMLALICLSKSYEYDDYIHSYAEIFIDLFQEILFCGEVHKIYIQLKAIDTDVPIEERGSKHATTRFSILFSAKNQDIFVLRIDLPHKGEEKVHLNMHECVNGKMLRTGYPIRCNESLHREFKMRMGENFEALFYEMNNHIWFKSEFEKKLQLLEINKEFKDYLHQLFRDRSHYTINIDTVNEEQAIDFTNELKDYLANFSLHSNVLCSLDKGTIDYADEIKKIRMQQRLADALAEVALESCNTSIQGEENMWEIFSALGLDQTINKAEFTKKDISKAWEWIDRNVL